MVDRTSLDIQPASLRYIRFPGIANYIAGPPGDAGDMSENPQCVRKYDMKKVLGLRLTSGCDGYH